MDEYDGIADPNLHLPNIFVTCFSQDQLTVYQQAINEFAVKHPRHDLIIDTSGSWNDTQSPALLCYNRQATSLNEFWKIFEQIFEKRKS